MTVILVTAVLEEFVRRNEDGNCSDAEAIAFIERYLISDAERAEFRKRKLSVAGVLVGKYTESNSTEAFLEKTFKRWNRILDSNIFGYGRIQK